MAKKINLLKLPQESREQADATNRLAAKVSPALYMMQLRLPKLRISPLKRKLEVMMDPETLAQIEYPVKIRHVD